MFPVFPSAHANPKANPVQMSTYRNMNTLQRATLPQTRSKRLLRSTIYVLSYHFILKRRRTTVARVAGFRLTVRPTVFHPRYFLTSEFFAKFLSGMDLIGKRVADVGTGSPLGIPPLRGFAFTASAPCPSPPPLPAAPPGS
jgi:hypothetical protein